MLTTEIKMVRLRLKIFVVNFFLTNFWLKRMTETFCMEKLDQNLQPSIIFNSCLASNLRNQHKCAIGAYFRPIHNC